MTKPVLGRLLIYTKKLDEMTDFYVRHFGYTASHDPDDRIIELCPPDGGMTLLLHLAAKSQKDGQAMVKLVFDVADVAGFCAQAAQSGLVFGALHKGHGYTFANTKDPAGNSISVSSRAFAAKG